MDFNSLLQRGQEVERTSGLLTHLVWIAYRAGLARFLNGVAFGISLYLVYCVGSRWG